MTIYLLFEIRDDCYFNDSEGTYGYSNNILLGVYDSYEKANKVKEILGSISTIIEEAELNKFI